MKKNPFCLFSLFILSFFFFACSESEEHAGAEDFPNTISDLGKDIALSLDEGNDRTEVPKTILKQRPTLSQAIVTLDTAYQDHKDTASGYFIHTNEKHIGDTVKLSRIAIRWDEQAKDAINGNENIIWIEKRDSAFQYLLIERSTDLDGDSLLTPKAFGEFVVFSKRQIGNTSQENWIAINSGADGDFEATPTNPNARKDNGVLYGRSYNYVGKVLVDSSAYLDGDGDGFASLATKDSELMLVLKGEHPIIGAHTTYRMLLRSFPADTTKNYPVQFRQITTQGKVRKETEVENTEGGKTVAPGDTVVSVEKVYHDNILFQESRFTIELSNPWVAQGNHTLFFSQHTFNRRQGQKSFFIEVTPSQKLADGKKFSTGTITAKALNNNGDLFGLVGQFAATGITATVTREKDGATSQQSWTRDGL